MIDVDRLASVAAQFVGRVRDDDPDANVRWLRAMVDPEELEAFCFVLAAAVPADVPWMSLTAWAWVGLENPKVCAERRKVLAEALNGPTLFKGKAANVSHTWDTVAS